ncbi:hypothetical protein [Lonepinella sp. MS14436]|uniref:hypothetical protein n=1 Tax=Lonepinella sp. MS14436 TaxID=3003619 RepID=UPI0036DE5B10
MFKYLIIILSMFLVSCSYSEGCWYTPQMVSCVDKGDEFPYISMFQKKETLGHTDSEQRWKDIKSCNGVKRSNTDFFVKNDRDSDGIIIPEIVDEFERCMATKGYYLERDCGWQKPEWSTGKCNI